MELRYHVLDVFTDRAFGGNPLAVVFGGERLRGETMQAVAAEFNLSETVFVLPPTRSTATHRLRIFTPRAELPFAGHPTVGAGFLLAAIGECDLAAEQPALVLEEGIGDVPVSVCIRDGQPVGSRMSVPRMPERETAPVSAAELAEMLSLSAEALHPEVAPQAWSCGVPFLFIALRNVAAVSKAILRQEVWSRALQGHPARNVFVYAFGGVGPGVHIHARMFAPAFGIPEDPATGAAVSALAACLAQSLPDGRHAWRVEQGMEMNRPSRLELECEKAHGRLCAVRVGGPSVRIAEGLLRLP